MFQVGDKVFYPTQGGGIIQTIEKKEILGKAQVYYIVNILHKNMKVMIPVDNTNTLGIRPVVDPQKLDNVLTTFHDGETDTSCKDTQRHRVYMDKLKSGDIYEEAAIIRDLMRIGNKKKLGITDKNMLNTARQVLISEVELVKGISQEEASDLLDRTINIS